MTGTNEEQEKADARGGLTVEIARLLFDEMSADATTDSSIVERYYHPAVRFQDPIQRVEGRDAFVEMSDRLVRRCSELRARVNDAAQTGDVIFLQWTMWMRMGRGPRSTIEGTTRLRLDGEGRVVDHRDYFDLWGDALGDIPVVGPLYRRFVGLMG